MSQQCSWPTHSWPLEGRCLYYALPGLTQAPGLAGGPDLLGQYSVFQGQNTACILRHMTVMGNLNDGIAVPVQLAEQSKNFLPGLGIQRAGRLIRQQNSRAGISARAMATRCC